MPGVGTIFLFLIDLESFEQPEVQANLSLLKAVLEVE